MAHRLLHHNADPRMGRHDNGHQTGPRRGLSLPHLACLGYRILLTLSSVRLSILVVFGVYHLFSCI